jgi:hypothetical protein
VAGELSATAGSAAGITVGCAGSAASGEWVVRLVPSELSSSASTIGRAHGAGAGAYGGGRGSWGGTTVEGGTPQ